MSAKKKAFFHYEARGRETYTKSVTLRPGSSVAEALLSFTKCFQLDSDHQLHSDHPQQCAQLGDVQLMLTDSSGNIFEPADDLFALLDDKDDCFVVSKKKSKTRAPAPPPAPATSTTSTSTSTPSTSTATPPATTANKGASKANTSTGTSAGTGAGAGTGVPIPPQSGGKQLDYDQLMTSVDDLVAQKSLRKARDICLIVVSNPAHSNDIRALEHLCTIAFKCRQYSVAVEHGERALQGFVAARAKLQKNANNMPLLLSLLRVLQTVARSHAALDDAEEALERVSQGLHLLASCCRQNPSIPCAAKLSLLPATILQGSYTDSHHLRSEVLASPTIVPLSSHASASPTVVAQQKSLITLELDFKADLTSYLFAVGRNEEAGAVVNALVGHPSSANHLLSLLVYAEIAAAYNKVPEAVQGALKAVVLDSTHKRAKALMAKLLSTDAGLQEVYKQVPPTPQAAAAYAFLASVAKDLSYLDAANTLLRQVVKQDPRKDATHFLGLVHVQEGMLDLKGALNTIILAINSQQRRVEYEDSQATSEFYPGTTVRRWCQEWNELLTEATRNFTGGKGGKGAPIVDVATDTQGLYVSFVKKGGVSSPAVLLPSGKATSGTHQIDGDFALVCPVACDFSQTGSNDTEQEKADTQALDMELRGPDKSTKEYGSNELDILALAFTAVKLLFLLGQLGALPRLIRHLEWARRASKKPLHETNIRNEHAYYLCIVQIMGFYSAPDHLNDPKKEVENEHVKDPFSPLSKINVDIFATLASGGRGAKALYVCGDSHVLSSAYAVIRPGGEPRVLVPRLVTGVKQWHLRSESNFYTKEIFRRSLATVPDGSEVMFLIGEIDCREGILVAVEKGVYRDVEEGMRTTLNTFKRVVQDLIHKKRLQVYIHPVIPVLDVTRQIVLMFNKLFKTAMSGIKGCHWLDIESDFVEVSPVGKARVQGDGACSLRSELQLDGTHVSPGYVPLLEASISRCLSAKQS